MQRTRPLHATAKHSGLGGVGALAPVQHTDRGIGGPFSATCRRRSPAMVVAPGDSERRVAAGSTRRPAPSGNPAWPIQSSGPDLASDAHDDPATSADTPTLMPCSTAANPWSRSADDAWVRRRLPLRSDRSGSGTRVGAGAARPGRPIRRLPADRARNRLDVQFHHATARRSGRSRSIRRTSGELRMLMSL